MKNYKKITIFLIIFIFFFIIFFNLFIKNKNKNKNNFFVKPTLELIPTVDSSVNINLKLIKKGELNLTITNEPKNTNLIEFELLYKTINKDNWENDQEFIEQGVIGKCYFINKIWYCGEDDKFGKRKIILGTCSSGTCRYHDLVGNLKLVIKFYGNYGQKIFEKEYKL
ncbi:MAG: hypothetical protein N2593_01150 [Patescibacteria group bacterium]|nr:hypothetical protein [Patescibacteria group bacterium]